MSPGRPGGQRGHAQQERKVQSAHSQVDLKLGGVPDTQTPSDWRRLEFPLAKRWVSGNPAKRWVSGNPAKRWVSGNPGRLLRPMS
jgi:hypothetical protein